MTSAGIPEWALILAISLLPLVAWWVWANFIRKSEYPDSELDDCPFDVTLYFLAAVFLCPVIWLLSLLVTLDV